MRDLTQLLSNVHFNAKLPTVLYISGWTQSPDASTTRALVKAYLKRGDYNILLLDWSDYSVGIYAAVMIRISKISRLFGRELPKLFDQGLNAKFFHCIGHSFGAHSCGIIGRELNEVSKRKYKLGRFVFCFVSKVNCLLKQSLQNHWTRSSWPRLLSCEV